MRQEEKLKETAYKTLLLLRRPDAAANIYIIPDSLMRKLNFKYRRKDKPTTVLSFSDPKIPHPETKMKFLGDIYLAPRYIKKSGGDIKELLIHGLLHLVGYDHEKKDDKIRMEKKEQELFRKLFGKN